MERRDLSAESGLQLQDQLPKTGMVVVHIGHKNDAGKIKLFAKLPRFLRSYFNTGLAVNHDHCGIGNADGFLRLSHKVEVPGSVQKIDLNRSVLTLKFQRHQGGGNGKLSLDLFLIIITDGGAVHYITHSLGNSGHQRHGFHQGRLTCTAMA